MKSQEFKKNNNKKSRLIFFIVLYIRVSQKKVFLIDPKHAKYDFKCRNLRFKLFALDGW